MDIWDPDEEERQLLDATYRGAAFSFFGTPRGAPHWTEREFGKGSALAEWTMAFLDRPDRGPQVVGLDAGIGFSEFTKLTAHRIAQVYKVPKDMLRDSHFDMESEVRRDTVDAFALSFNRLADESAKAGYAIDRFKDTIETKLDPKTGILDVTMTVPLVRRYIESTVKIEFSPIDASKADWVTRDELPDQGARGCAGRGFLSSPGGSSPPRSTPPQGPTLGGYLVPPELERSILRGFQDDLSIGFRDPGPPPLVEGYKDVVYGGVDPLWYGETNFDTSSADGTLTVEKLQEIARKLGPPPPIKYGRNVLHSWDLAVPQPTKRINPMKTSKIAIPYDRDNPTRVELVDLPSHCEVVHISGNDETAFLHIAQADDPSNAKTPTAFFVVADGIDVPGFVVTKKNGNRDRGYDEPRTTSDSDKPEPVYVRRVGKFEIEGEVRFIFERLS